MMISIIYLMQVIPKQATQMMIEIVSVQGKVINHNGVFIDNTRISNVTIDQFHLDYRDKIYFRMAVPDSSKHIGGLTVFGRGFGNYNQDIEFRVQYSPIAGSTPV